MISLNFHLNPYIRAIGVALAVMTASVPIAEAQDTQQQSSSSAATVVRRGNGERRGPKDEGTGLTTRMEEFYRQRPTSEADLSWMRVIYRSLDLEDDRNAVLYYPEDPVEGQDNLFRIIMNLVAKGRIPAYQYLDGREIFTDQYKVNTRDVLNDFHIMFTEAKGSTDKRPMFDIDPSDVPANEVLSYYIIERWEYDTRHNNMNTRVEAICPVLHRTGDFGGEAVKYPMFWVKMSDLRPYLAQQYVFTSDDNNLPTCTLDDFFAMNMYDGEIYKTRNLKNKSMMQLHPDPDDMKRAQDSIQHRLDHWEDKLWVPSREEVIAAREAREALEAAADSTALAEGGLTTEATKKTTRTRSSRKPAATKTKTKKAKVKEPKAPKATSNSAAKSVRRRRR